MFTGLELCTTHVPAHPSCSAPAAASWSLRLLTLQLSVSRNVRTMPRDPRGGSAAKRGLSATD